MDHSKMSHESMDHDQKTKRQIEIMTSKFLRPTLMALAVSTSPAFFSWLTPLKRWITQDGSRLDGSYGP
jgi:hypothetical protein